MRAHTAHTYAIATWIGLATGLLEAVILYIVKAYPAILAPYKVSAHILWVAPVVNIAAALALAGLLALIAKPAGERIGVSPLLFVTGGLVFLSVLLLCAAPAVIYFAGAVLLSAGIALATSRRLRGHEYELADYLRRRMAWIPAIVVLLWLSASFHGGAYEKWAAGKLPSPARGANVLLIVLDTIRHDRFDAARNLTPELNRFLAGGVRFENAWATSSWSLVSQASILTGRYPADHKADWPGLALSRNHQTLAELFRQLGYATGAFSGNSAWATPDYLGRGFLRFEVYRLEDVFRRTTLLRKARRLLSYLGWDEGGRGRKAPALNHDFLRFVDDYPSRPFFAYLCYMDVNQAYYHAQNRGFGAPAPAANALFAAYDEALRTLDRQVAGMLRELEKRGRLSNTVVVLTSDHGQSFGASGGDHDPSGHGTSLYLEQIKVPLFVVPAGGDATLTVWRNVSAVQIAPTITRLLDIPGKPFPYEPLISPNAGPLHKPDWQAMATLKYDFRDVKSLISGQWHFLEDLSNPLVQKSPEELYDFPRDPGETEDLAGRTPDLPALREQLRQALAGAPTANKEISY